MSLRVVRRWPIGCAIQLHARSPVPSQRRPARPAFESTTGINTENHVIGRRKSDGVLPPEVRRPKSPARSPNPVLSPPFSARCLSARRSQPEVLRLKFAVPRQKGPGTLDGKTAFSYHASLPPPRLARPGCAVSGGSILLRQPAVR